MKRIGLVLLLFVGACSPTMDKNSACNAAFDLATTAADSAYVYRTAPRCAAYDEAWVVEPRP